jgi:hypothetical protein
LTYQRDQSTRGLQSKDLALTGHPRGAAARAEGRLMD